MATQTRSATPRSVRGYFFMAMLALQYGGQGVLNKWFVPKGTLASELVIVQEMTKLVLALTMLCTEGVGLSKGFANWSLRSSLFVACLPSLIYAAQNLLMWISAAHLDGLTYTVINQSKLISTALFVYLVLGQAQSRIQCVALAMLFGTAVILSLNGDAESKENDFWLGIVPNILASILSGLASALCQYALQKQNRDSYVFTIELCVWTTLTVILSLLFTPDGHEAMSRDRFFQGWDWKVFLPIVSAALGGIFIGQVVKYAGGVQKGISIIMAMLLASFLQCLVLGKPLDPAMTIALPLALFGLFLHTNYPAPKKPKPNKKD